MKPAVFNLEMVAIHRSCLMEHRGFWAIQDHSYPTLAVGDTINFTHNKVIIESGTVTHLEPPGICSNPKFEYFRQFFKIWYHNDKTEHKPTDCADWTGISPIARVIGEPNRLPAYESLDDSNHIHRMLKLACGKLRRGNDHSSKELYNIIKKEIESGIQG